MLARDSGWCRITGCMAGIWSLFLLLGVLGQADAGLTVSKENRTTEQGETSLIWQLPNITRVIHGAGSRIVGGRFARSGEVPWQVSIQTKFRGTYFHFCGGSIIDNSTVLTAAHCFYGNQQTSDLQNLRIVAGSLHVLGGERTTQILGVVRLRIHPKYNDMNPLNDIAMLKVKNEFNFSSSPEVASVPLRRNAVPVGKECVVSGWGDEHEGLELGSLYLRIVRIPAMSKMRCADNYNVEPSVLEGVMCTYAVGKDSCQGDSGGPVVCDGELTGIVSSGEGCARLNRPGIQTEVAYYYDWIASSSLGVHTNLALITCMVMFIKFTV